MVWARPETKPRNDQPEMRQRAKWLVEYLDAHEFQVVISTPVIAELLAFVPEERRVQTTAALRERFVITDFDVRAAQIVASHVRDSKDLKNDGAPQARNLFKQDLAIVAAARALGATDFYSNDEGCRKIAKRVGMRSHDLPDRSWVEPRVSEKQEAFFEEGEAATT